jgi:threonine/homoserine/homoserine lactone efflux protein
MLDYSTAHWLTFLTAAVLLNLSPGPDMAFILGHTVRGGKRCGFAAMAGVWMGALLHIIAAAAGLSAILASSATAFTAVKWLGAGYLIWLGFSALMSKGPALSPSAAAPSISTRQVLRQGVLVSLLNPKVAIFFLAFLPQFVVPGAGATELQMLLHGLLVVAVAAVVEPPLVIFGEKLTQGIRNRPEIALWLDKTLGAVLVALGVRLITQDYP